jgi:CubicO group peptidase (beta-lactamase class C family)
MTKPVTGVALMTLYEQGRFKLDDPLAKYAPEFAELAVFAGKDADGNPVYETPRRAPTIRDLTRHTAGFSRGESSGDPLAEAYTADEPLRFDNTLTQMASSLHPTRLPSAALALRRFGGVQAFLVNASAVAFADYLIEHVFAPLRMYETRYYFGPEYDHRRTVIYERQPDGGFAPEDPAPIEYNREPRTLTPGGWGLISTLDDYMRFARMLLGGGELDGVRILQPETVRLMATNALPATLKDSSWLPSKGQMGFGIDFATRIASPATADENSGEIGEFFWDGRASTLFWVDPQNDIAAVLFTQMMPFNTLPVHKEFRDAIYWNDATATAPRTEH